VLTPANGRQVQVVSKVRPPTRAGPGPHSTAEEISENPRQIAKPPAEEISELEIAHQIIRRPPLTDAGMTRRVVLFPLRFVGQDSIGFRKFAEFCRGTWILVLIRMVSDG